MWGGGISLAYAVQVAVTLAVVGGLAWLWRSNYDLMLLAPAIAILAADRMQRGFHPWQKSLLAALWLMPILARPAAQATLIPLAVPAMLVAFAWLLRRVMTQPAQRRCGVLRSAH